MLVKIYDHTGAEALHSALSETKSGTEVERGTITAIVIQLAAKAVWVIPVRMNECIPQWDALILQKKWQISGSKNPLKKLYKPQYFCRAFPLWKGKHAISQLHISRFYLELQIKPQKPPSLTSRLNIPCKFKIIYCCVSNGGIAPAKCVI